MSLVSKALITAVTVFVGNEVRRYAGTLELDDLLHPIGLQQRRAHLGESLLFMGAGVFVGGAAAMLLASTTRNDITEWLSRYPKETEEDEKNTVDLKDGEMANDGSPTGDNERGTATL